MAAWDLLMLAMVGVGIVGLVWFLGYYLRHLPPPMNRRTRQRHDRSRDVAGGRGEEE